MCPSCSLSVSEELSHIQRDLTSVEAASTTRSGTTFSVWLAGSARWVVNDRDTRRYCLVRSVCTRRQCAGGRCWRPYMLRAAAALGSQGGYHRRRVCPRCRSHRFVRNIDHRDCPWCLGVSRDTGPSYRSRQRRFEACRAAAAVLPLELADASGTNVSLRHGGVRNDAPDDLRASRGAAVSRRTVQPRRRTAPLLVRSWLKTRRAGPASCPSLKPSLSGASRRDHVPDGCAGLRPDGRANWRPCALGLATKRRPVGAVSTGGWRQAGVPQRAAARRP